MKLKNSVLAAVVLLVISLTMLGCFGNRGLQVADPETSRSLSQEILVTPDRVVGVKSRSMGIALTLVYDVLGFVVPVENKDRLLHFENEGFDVNWEEKEVFIPVDEVQPDSQIFVNLEYKIEGKKHDSDKVVRLSVVNGKLQLALIENPAVDYGVDYVEFRVWGIAKWTESGETFEAWVILVSEDDVEGVKDSKGQLASQVRIYSDGQVLAVGGEPDFIDKTKSPENKPVRL